MKRHKLQISALLALTVFLGTSGFSAYGLTTSKTVGTVDAIASATQAAPKPTPTPPTPAPAPKPVVKPVVKPAPQPAPVTAVPTPTTAEFTETGMGLTVLGKALTLGATPVILTNEGQPMLPLRKTAEAMGYTVKWDDQKKAAILENAQSSILLYRDNVNYLRGNTAYALNRKPVIFKNSLYVPMDFITGDSAYRLELASDTIIIDVAKNEVKPAITTPKQKDSDDEEDDD